MCLNGKQRDCEQSRDRLSHRDFFLPNDHLTSDIMFRSVGYWSVYVLDRLCSKINNGLLCGC